MSKQIRYNQELVMIHQVQALAEIIFGRFGISSGTFLCFLSPNPNSPYSLYPQLQTFPFASTNKLKEFPAETDMIGGRLLIFLGVEMFVLLPNPN